MLILYETRVITVKIMKAKIAIGVNLYFINLSVQSI